MPFGIADTSVGFATAPLHELLDRLSSTGAR
ncbi:MAG: hypothetical protein ACKO1X_04515 [Acidimicrobiales bacterium]